MVAAELLRGLQSGLMRLMVLLAQQLGLDVCSTGCSGSFTRTTCVPGILHILNLGILEAAAVGMHKLLVRRPHWSHQGDT
jgi:hypothetical protein